MIFNPLERLVESFHSADYRRYENNLSDLGKSVLKSFRNHREKTDAEWFVVFKAFDSNEITPMGLTPATGESIIDCIKRNKTLLCYDVLVARKIDPSANVHTVESFRRFWGQFPNKIQKPGDLKPFYISAIELQEFWPQNAVKKRPFCKN